MYVAAPCFIAFVLMDTERRPNSVSNPSSKIPALWFDFSLEDDNIKIIFL